MQIERSCWRRRVAEKSNCVQYEDSFDKAIDCCNNALPISNARDDIWDEKAYALWRRDMKPWTAVTKQ